MKTRKKILALVVSTLLLVTMMAVPVSAASYSGVAGGTCSFNKYLIVDAGDNIPNATFSFTIEPGTARSADTSDNTVMEVLPGVVKRDNNNKITSPSIADVTFGPTDEIATDAGTNIDVARTQKDRTGTAGTDTVQLDAGEKYATKPVTVDFSKVSFGEPGIYRYIITETANANHAAAGIIHDTDTDRVLDVYVTDNGTGTLVVSAYVLHTKDDDVVINNTMGSGDVTTAVTDLDDKTDGFTNEYTSNSLTFGKEVTGNQGSKDKYFKFTVTAEKNDATDKDTVNSNDVFTVETNADAAPTANGATTYTANEMQTANTLTDSKITGAQLIAGKVFYLQDGQYVTIKGLPKGFKYNVTEVEEDYKKTEKIQKGDSSLNWDGTEGNDALTDATSGTIETADIHTGFTNTRDGIIPTGILLSATPWIILGIVAVAGIIFFAIRSKKSYENE